MQHGEVVARIETPYHTVCAALDSRLPELRQALEDAGIRVTTCQVSVQTQAGRDGQPSWQMAQHHQRQGWPSAVPPSTGLPPGDDGQPALPPRMDSRARTLDFFA
jgi:hypothetical protein